MGLFVASQGVEEARQQGGGWGGCRKLKIAWEWWWEGDASRMCYSSHTSLQGVLHAKHPINTKKNRKVLWEYSVISFWPYQEGREPTQRGSFRDTNPLWPPIAEVVECWQGVEWQSDLNAQEQQKNRGLSTPTAKYLIWRWRLGAV